MNILLIEDEKDLSASAVIQMQVKGHKVHPVFDLTEARAALDEGTTKFQVVIADHQLPDGLGIQFVKEVRADHPECVFAIVSGCLGDEEEEDLSQSSIPYFKKPLIYGKVLDKLRKSHCMDAPIWHEDEEPSPESEDEEVQAEPEPKPKRKKFFGLF